MLQSENKKEFVIYHELYQGDKRFPAWGEALYLKIDDAVLV
jgi:hypothetical protein